MVTFLTGGGEGEGDKHASVQKDVVHINAPSLELTRVHARHLSRLSTVEIIKPLCVVLQVLRHLIELLLAS